MFWDKLGKTEKKKNGYIINKGLFRFGLLLCVVVVLIVGMVDGVGVVVSGSQAITCDAGENNYFVADNISMGVCINPYYDPLAAEGISSREWLSHGETVGVVPSPFTFAAPYFIWGIFLSCIVVNHLLYNRRNKN